MHERPHILVLFYSQRKGVITPQSSIEAYRDGALPLVLIHTPGEDEFWEEIKMEPTRGFTSYEDYVISTMSWFKSQVEDVYSDVIYSSFNPEKCFKLLASHACDLSEGAFCVKVGFSIPITNIMHHFYTTPAVISLQDREEFTIGLIGSLMNSIVSTMSDTSLHVHKHYKAVMKYYYEKFVIK